VSAVACLVPPAAKHLDLADAKHICDSAQLARRSLMELWVLSEVPDHDRPAFVEAVKKVADYLESIETTAEAAVTP
jgi:hypothetical protein